MNITVKKLAELHILRILWTTIYNDHNARIKEEQNHGKH
jgi:hypothetical protein